MVATTIRPTTLAKSLAKLEQIEVSAPPARPVRGRAPTAGIGVDLRIARPAQLGDLLQHFTGSGAHNAALREAAVRAACTCPSTASSTTPLARPRIRQRGEVYERLGLAYIEPELREDRGELAAARDGTLPG